MAYEGARRFGEEFCCGLHIEYDGGDWGVRVWFTEYGGDEVKHEFPVRFEFMTLNEHV